MSVPEFLIDQSVPGHMRLVGELDLFTGADLTVSLAALDGAAMEIDLAGVSFMDSCGLRTMLRLHQMHPGIRFVHATLNMSRLLEIAGVSTLMADYGDDPPVLSA
jgi:anti-anti-sigma factor